MTYYSLQKFDTAVSQGDMTQIQKLWPQIRRSITLVVDRNPADNLPLNQE